MRSIVIRDNEVGIGFPKGLKARALGECLLEEVFVASSRISDANADKFRVAHCWPPFSILLISDLRYLLYPPTIIGVRYPFFSHRQSVVEDTSNISIAFSRE